MDRGFSASALPGVWGRMLLCWSSPCLPRCGAARWASTHWKPGAPPLVSPPPVVTTKNTCGHCPMSPGGPRHPTAQERRWGSRGGGDVSEDRDRISAFGLQLSCVLPGKLQNPWALVSLSLKWEEREEQMQGAWRSVEIMHPIAL